MSISNVQKQAARANVDLESIARTASPRSLKPSRVGSRARSTSGTQPRVETNNCKTWVAGFPRPVLASVMHRHATAPIQQHVPEGVVALPTADSIIFDTNEVF